MVRNGVLTIVIAAISLQAALGSGPFVKTSFGLVGLYGDELYMIPSEIHYRHITDDSLILHYKDFAKPGIFLRPSVVIGWEQSFNRVLSINGGIGLAFCGARWETETVDNFSGQPLSSSGVDASLHMIYINIPVDAKLMLPINSGDFTISGGPRFAFLTSARFKNNVLSEEIDDRSFYSPLSFGIGGAFGGEIQLRKLDLLMALKVDAGLTNESKDQSLLIRNFNLGIETGLRWTTKRLKKSPKWPL